MYIPTLSSRIIITVYDAETVGESKIIGSIHADFNKL